MTTLFLLLLAIVFMLPAQTVLDEGFETGNTAGNAMVGWTQENVTTGPQI